MVTILTEQGPREAPAEADPATASLWMTPDDVEDSLGWALKPEGLCRGEVCVPIPPGEASSDRPGRLDAAAFWRRMGKPVLHSAERDVWLLGEDAGTRARALESLEAPDFALPDLAGRAHSLSEHRGRKVLLATWASW